MLQPAFLAQPWCPHPMFLCTNPGSPGTFHRFAHTWESDILSHQRPQTLYGLQLDAPAMASPPPARFPNSAKPCLQQILLEPFLLSINKVRKCSLHVAIEALLTAQWHFSVNSSHCSSMRERKKKGLREIMSLLLLLLLLITMIVAGVKELKTNISGPSQHLCLLHKKKIHLIIPLDFWTLKPRNVIANSHFPNICLNSKQSTHTVTQKLQEQRI